MELTKQELEKIFDQKLSKVATRDDLHGSEKKIIARIDKAQEELAQMTSHGFDDILDRLNVRERMQKLEKDMAKIKVALHLS